MNIKKLIKFGVNSDSSAIGINGCLISVSPAEEGNVEPTEISVQGRIFDGSFDEDVVLYFLIERVAELEDQIKEVEKAQVVNLVFEGSGDSAMIAEVCKHLKPSFKINSERAGDVSKTEVFSGVDVRATDDDNDEKLTHLVELQKVMEDVHNERIRQKEKWGGSKHDDEHDHTDWRNFIDAYNQWAWMMANMESSEKAYRRYIQISALAAAAAESLIRKNRRKDRD